MNLTEQRLDLHDERLGFLEDKLLELKKKLTWMKWLSGFAYAAIGFYFTIVIIGKLTTL